ncbi:MAG: hypothetical protein NTU44_18310 [Bacteroidetes bacterium]|nr:hypothetical protein [Bacteroidota bacterium]
MVSYLKFFIRILIAIAGITLLPGVSFSQAARIFDASYCHAASPPMFLHFGEKVEIACDTVVIINASRYKLYEKARNYVMSLKPDDEKMMITEYESALQTANQHLEEIRAKYFKLSDEVHTVGVNNQASLERVNLDLENTRKELAAASNQLNEAARKLALKQRSSLRRTLIAGTAGMGIGLLLGLILFR